MYVLFEGARHDIMQAKMDECLGEGWWEILPGINGIRTSIVQRRSPTDIVPRVFPLDLLGSYVYIPAEAATEACVLSTICLRVLKLIGLNFETTQRFFGGNHSFH